VSYLERWRLLSQPARLYLLHVALLTFSLAIFGLFFNFAILVLGFSLEFLGAINTVSFAAAAALSVPLLWLVARLSLRRTLLASVMLQLAGVLGFALATAPVPLLAAAALAGVAAVLFEIAAAPFMMRHSDGQTRDHLFSANAAIRIGVAGAGSLVAGQIPGIAARVLGVAPQSAAAYQATLLVGAAGLGLSIVPLLFVRDGRQKTTDDRRPAKDQRPTATGERPKASTQPTGHGEDETSAWSLILGLWSRMVDRLPQEWRGLARHPIPLLKLLVSPALISVGAALLIPYLNLFFRERFALGDQALGALFAALGLATGVASLAGPALSGRLGKIRAVVLSQALALPFLVLLGIAPLLGVAVGAALARAALFNMGTPLYDAFAMERSDEAARPTVIGLMNGASSIGYAFAPLLSTWVQAIYGFGPIFMATGTCYALAVLAKYWFFVRGAPSSPALLTQGSGDVHE
jgi:MFS family permease